MPTPPAIGAGVESLDLEYSDLRLFFDAVQERFWLLWQSAERKGKIDVPGLTKKESSLRGRMAGGNDDNLPLPQERGHIRRSIGASRLLFFLRVSS
jgi:hypothetical protein